MMPMQQPPPEQIRAAIEVSRKRLTILDKLQEAYTALISVLPAGAVLNGLQVVAGDEVREIPADPIRALLEAQTAAAALEANALRGQIAGLEQMLPGHLVVARPRLA